MITEAQRREENLIAEKESAEHDLRNEVEREQSVFLDLLETRSRLSEALNIQSEEQKLKQSLLETLSSLKSDISDAEAEKNRTFDREKAVAEAERESVDLKSGLLKLESQVSDLRSELEKLNTDTNVNEFVPDINQISKMDAEVLEKQKFLDEKYANNKNGVAIREMEASLNEVPCFSNMCRLCTIVSLFTAKSRRQ